MPPEQLLFFAAFLLLSLVNMVVRFLRTRARQAREAAEREAAEREAARAPRVELPGPPPPAWPRPLPVEVRRPDAAPTPTAPRPVPAARRQPRRPAATLLGRPADLRRTIVLMTVLGPCRALEGQESRPGG
jgi:hypothetical protein